MAFVKMISLYGEEINIPAGAVKAYSNLGYNEVSKGYEEEVTKGSEVPQLTDDEIYANGLAKKPLAGWSKEEVKRYAEIYEIDLAGTKNANEAKDRIKDFLNSQEA